jgi:nitrogen fixation/metabolism regulation signal transduction histidine kinase
LTAEKNNNKKRGNFSIYLPKSKMGIFRRLLLSSILISIVPLIILYYYTTSVFNDLNSGVSTHLTETIDQKTKKTTELQAALLANTIERFLKKCESDLMALSELEPTPQKYLEFNREHSGVIWYRFDKEGIPLDIHKSIPLFKEISFVDTRGMEKVRISDGKIVSVGKLKNVKSPKNTRYKNEHYFERTIKLKPNQIYVSHLNGFHVSKKEQLGNSKSLETAFHGVFYDGVIRFARPVYENGKLIGIAVLGLDHRHLMEFTQHVLPNRTQQIVSPSYSSGDYAFMFDDEGWTITHPKLWDIKGADKNGKLIPPYTESSSKKDIELGLIPFNLDYAAFIHPNYPYVADEIQRHQIGSVLTTNIGGIKKIMAYAPILFNEGVYRKSGVFGGITIGLQLRHFNEQAKLISKDINSVLMYYKNDIIYYVIIIFGIAVLLSLFVSRNFSKPIVELTKYSQEFASGDLDKYIPIERDDEIGTLASSLNFMAYELYHMKNELEVSLAHSKKATREAKEYAQRVEYQLKIFKGILEVSNLLGTTFNLDKILKLILKHSVETIGFDRAVLYLVSDDREFLEFKDMCGFSEEERNRLERSKYHLQNDDCIETKVAREGEIYFIKDFVTYKHKSGLDEKIRESGKSKSFIYIPLKTKDAVIGILGADKYKTKEIILDEEVESLQILANQAARIIEITKLYQQIIDQRNFVSDILKFMPSGVITINQDGFISSINESAVKMLDLEPEGIIQQKDDTVFSGYADLKDEIRLAISRRGFYTNDDFKTEINGAVKYFSIYVSPILKNEETEKEFLVILEDKTERKLIDEEVKGIEKLAFLGRFAAGIAHEIRNPLTGISLFLDDLHDTLAADQENGKVIELALNEVERLENLVNEILDYASPSKGEFEEQDINTIIESTITFVKSFLKKKNIKLETEFSDSIPKVKVMKDKIVQALLNIIINSVEILSENGKIEIKTEFLKHDSALINYYLSIGKKIGSGVVVTICDNGKGIDDKIIDNIFDPFFTTKEKGTGLGLSITHSIITEHNGKIFVFNRKDGGACFSVHLPLT